MRKLKWLSLTGVTVGWIAAVGWSCGSTDVTCEDLATCRPVDGGSTSGTGGNGGCTSTEPPATSTCVNEAAVFVSPKGNDASGTGRKAAPYKTIAMALQAASKTTFKRVYACDDGTGYPESLSIEATLDGLTIYGGFDCAWTYGASAHRAKVNPPTGSPVTVKGLTKGLTMEDFELVAATATMPGGSSIGVIVDTSANVVFRGVRIAAANGAPGSPGVDGAGGQDAPMVQGQQQGLNASCAAVGTLQPGGAWPSMSGCGSRGGPGGDGRLGSDGSAGSAGNPRANVTPLDNDNSGAKGPTGEDGKPGSNG